MTMETTPRERGRSITREMMGEATADRLFASATSNAFGADIAGYALDHAFGEIWMRPGLDRRSRSLITMAVMVALRQPKEFAIHVRIALENGLSPGEIEEMLTQAVPYVGFPAVSTALPAAIAVIEELGLDPSPDYAGHRGLL